MASAGDITCNGLEVGRRLIEGTAGVAGNLGVVRGTTPAIAGGGIGGFPHYLGYMYIRHHSIKTECPSRWGLKRRPLLCRRERSPTGPATGAWWLGVRPPGLTGKRRDSSLAGELWIGTGSVYEAILDAVAHYHGPGLAD